MENNLENAIEAAYQAEVTKLYGAFFESMLLAEDDAKMIRGAQDRFKASLDRAAGIHKSARTIAGLFVL